jgi:uncharacterized protein (TIGR03435 family)
LNAAAPLGFLIENAFNVPAVEILGAPPWVKSKCFRIEARGGDNTSNAQLLLMLQSLLEDRFQLKTHREARQLPVYLLQPARSGLKLPEPKENNCWPADESTGTELPVGNHRRLPSFFKCGRIIPGGGVDTPTQSLKGGSVAMPELVRAVSILVGRPVIDKTGFSGMFDVDMTFAADPSALDPGETPASGLPSIFLALEERLGLKLESSKASVDVLVIDRVAEPSGN